MADILSLESEDGLRCVDVVALPGRHYGLKEFRRDPEDGGGWTLVADYAATGYDTREAAVAAARERFAWLPGA